MDDRIKTGFQDLMGFRLFKGLDVQGFQCSDAWILVFRILGSQDFIGCRTFGFSDIDLGSSCLFRILVFFGIGWTLVFRIGSFSFADTKMEKCNRLGKLIR